MRIGGVAIDTAVTTVFLTALAPSAAQACLAAAQQLEDGHDAALAQWRRQVETARYDATTAQRRYQAVDPENRLVARGLEQAWETALRHLADTQAELARRETARPKTLTPQEKTLILTLGADLDGVWDADTTTDRDRKQLLRTLLDEVNITVHRDHTDSHADLVVRWKGGAISELSVPVKRKPPNTLRTDEDTIDLIRRLAAHYPDATIAHILNRQDRRTARGLSYTAGRVQSLRHHYNIPCHQHRDDPAEGEPLTVTDAAKELRLAPSTLHRWLGDGFIAGEQLTPGAPWRIPPHRRHPRPVRRQRPRRLAGNAGGHPRPRRVPPNHHATCQARRTASRPRPHRTPKRPAYPATTHPGRTVLTMTINERSSVTMHPSSRPRPFPPPSGHPPRLIHEHLQPVVRRALRAEPERTRQKVGFKDRLEHDLHRSLHDSVTDCGNRQRPPLLGPRLRYEYPPGRDRTERLRPQLRFQFIEQPGHPVLLDLGQGDLVDARRAAVAAHLAPRPLQNVPAVDLVIQRVESSSGIGLGRPVQRMLQGTDRVEPTLDTWGGTSTYGTHRPLLVNLRADEAAALPLTGGCVVHPARPVL